jgi:hypothetical protein
MRPTMASARFAGGNDEIPRTLNNSTPSTVTGAVAIGCSSQELAEPGGAPVSCPEAGTSRSVAAAIAAARTMDRHGLIIRTTSLRA